MKSWRKYKRKMERAEPEGKAVLTDRGRLIIALWASEQSLDGFDSSVKHDVQLLNTDFDAAKVAAAFFGIDGGTLRTVADARVAIRRKVGLER